MYVMQCKLFCQVIGVFTLFLLLVPPTLSQVDGAEQEEVNLEKEPWEEPLPEGLYIKPYLQNVTQQSIVVMWETIDPVIGHVDYGETQSFGKTLSEPTAVTIHEVRIGDLDPGAVYHYYCLWGCSIQPQTASKKY